MKRVLSFLAVILALSIITAISIKPTILFLTQKQLSKIFEGSSVSIGRCQFSSPNQLSFHHIEIHDDKKFKIIIRDVVITFTLDFDPKMKWVQSMDADIASIEGYGALSKNILVKIGRNNLADMAIEKIRYGKMEMRRINGQIQIKDKELIISPLSAKILDGNIAGYATLKTGQVPEYFLNLTFNDLRVKKLVNDFDLHKKFEMTGLMGGQLALKGKGAQMDVLNGSFSMAKEGGVLVIHDTRFLENIAKGSGQSLDILVESFKNYHYNTGDVELSLVENHLKVDVSLDGETGKRDLNIKLHDFLSMNWLAQQK